MTFDEIVKMVTRACIRTFHGGYGNHEEAIIQCATQIYIAQMNKNEERLE